MKGKGRASHREGLVYSTNKYNDEGSEHQGPRDMESRDKVDEEKDEGTKIRGSKGVEGRT